MTLLAKITSYWEAFLRLIYPAHCAVCSLLLEIEERGVCAGCLARLKTLRYSMEEIPVEERFEALDDAYCLYPYAPPLKEILTAVKFLKKRWLVRIFREEMRPFIQALAAEARYDFLLPVPLDRNKRLEREFNQSEEIARMVAVLTGIPSRSSVLGKRRGTAPQSELTRAERRVNLFRAFRVAREKDVRHKNILLVDDIFTTGATADEAARTLKEAGAGRVDLFAIARTEAGKNQTAREVVREEVFA